MAQQRIKFVLDKKSSRYTTTVQADTNTLSAAPVALDTNEEFRLIVADTALDPDWLADRLQQLIVALRDDQLVLNASVA